MKRNHNSEPEKYIFKCMKWVCIGDLLAIVFGIFIKIPYISCFGCLCLLPGIHNFVLFEKEMLSEIKKVTKKRGC